MKEAVGMIEVRSLSGAIQAADTMLKSAAVRLVKLDFVGSGIVCAVVTGEVSAVLAAVENARRCVEGMAEIISVNVIPRPVDEIDKLFM